MRRVVDDIDDIGEDLRAIGDLPPPAPRWTQDWFPRLDAAVAYAMVRTRRPPRIVEVGCGHSTRFFARAAADAGHTLHLTAIDPKPRSDIGAVAHFVLEVPVQQAGLAPFAPLEAGDILSIDSSHVLMPGTDVDYLLNRVLPLLPAGVLVHVHDIFLPEDYPHAWGWRGYNEQLAVAALVHGGRWRMLWASRYALRALDERLGRSVIAQLPLPDGAFECSLWMVRNRD